jgi:polar amino acid transport system substrate-binding protein
MRTPITLLKSVIMLSLFLALLQPNRAAALSEKATPPAATPKLVVGVVHDPPYLVKDANGEWSGLNVDIWKAVAQDLKVDYEFREMEFHQLLEGLKSRTLDITIETLFVVAERERFMDYSFAFGSTRLALATSYDKLDHPWWMAVKLFFSWGTLKIVGLLALLLCILGLLFWLIERKVNPDHFGGNILTGIVSGIYWVGSTLASGVCFGISLKSLPARILGLIWMLMCAVALSALIASLSASLSAARLTTQLVNDDTLRRMHLGGVRHSAELTFLKKLGGKYVEYSTEEDALKAVLRGEVEGFVYDEITLRHYRDYDYKGKISVYQAGLKKFSFAFGLPKDSPWRSKVNIALLDLMEKPDWEFLLSRYGLNRNFEERTPQVSTGTRRSGS